MNDWLKPLFAFKKYLLAGKILNKINAHSHVLNIGFEGSYQESIYNMTFRKFKMDEIKKLFPDVTNQKLNNTIELLITNGHARKIDNKDFWSIIISCTEKGSRAAEDGFYKNQVIIFWAAFLGIPSIIGIIELFRTL